MDRLETARRLTEALALDIPPVGLAFTDGPVDGLETLDREVPSACAFWRLAADRCFYAPAHAHRNCPVGVATMGFEMTPDVAARLGEAAGLMVGSGYLDSAELPALPHMANRSEGIVYGPLAEFPLEPDVALVWMTPRSAMVFAEAQESARWDGAGAARVLGRPACACIPLAVEARSALSFGCSGMRTFTGIADSYLLGVIAGTALDATVTALERSTQANATMLRHYEEQASHFA